MPPSPSINATYHGKPPAPVGRSSRRRPQSLFAIVVAGVAFFLIIRFLRPNTFTLVWTAIQAADLGNAIAALLAVGGYMFEHWTSRKSSRLEAQMHRVSDQSHKLLVPVTMHYHSIMMCSLFHFIDKNFDAVVGQRNGTIPQHCLTKKYRELERSMREIAQKEITPLAIPTHMKNPDCYFMWLIECFLQQRENYSLVDSERPLLAATNMVPRLSMPRELPPFFHDAIAKVIPSPAEKQSQTRKSVAPPVSPLWHAYESFIRYEFLPGVERIADIIDEYGDLMEPVPASRLEEVFGRPDNGYGQPWRTIPRMWFYSFWLAYARAWKGVVNSWDDGIYRQMRPNIDFPTGILFFNIEGQSIVANVEKELVGMSQMHGKGEA